MEGLTLHAVAARHGLHPIDAYNFGLELSNGAVRYVGYVIGGGGSPYITPATRSPTTVWRPGLVSWTFDLALLLISGRDSKREAMDIVGNLDEEEAAQLAAESRVKVVVPMHYDMFAMNAGYPERLVQSVRLRNRALTVVILARGETFVYTGSEPNGT